MFYADCKNASIICRQDKPTDPVKVDIFIDGISPALTVMADKVTIDGKVTHRVEEKTG